MQVSASAVRKGDQFIPVLEVDGEKRYFESRVRHDHVTAIAYAELRLADLHRTILRFFQASGFVTQS